MNDPNSYGLYCAMLLQEYQQHGTALGDVDPSIVQACQSYFSGNHQSNRELNKEVCL